MFKLLKTATLFIMFVILPFFFARTAHAIRYNLVAPSGQLTRGQDVQFTVEIDTQGDTVTSTLVGLSYDTRYLEYVSTVPGNAMTTVTVSPSEAGKLVLSGTTAGFTGSSTYAFVTFKLIAQSPGSTQLCALFVPSPTTPPVPTNPPVALPTRLPKSGNESPAVLGSLFGVLFVVGTGAMLYMKKKTMFEVESPKKKETHPHTAKKHT